MTPDPADRDPSVDASVGTAGTRSVSSVGTLRSDPASEPRGRDSGAEDVVAWAERVHSAVLTDRWRLASVVGALAVSAVMAPQAWARPALWPSVVAAVALGAAFAVPWSGRRRAVAITTAATALSASALVASGPSAPAALAATVSTACGGVFFGTPGAVFTAAAAGAALLPSAFAGAHAGWTGSAAATLLALVWTGSLSSRLHGSVRGLLEGQQAARRAERQAQAERERMVRSAENAQRMEGLGRLAGGVAHAINNALVVVRAGVQEIGRATDPAVRARVLTEVDEAAGRAAATARRMMAFSRPPATGALRCDPADVLRAFGGSLGLVFPDNIRVRVQAADVAKAPIDAGTLEQSLLHLALNARDAMPKGGELVLGCADDLHADTVRVWVTDTGVGIPAADQDRVFEPFFTTKGDLGTGLGLATVWATTRKHRGWVELQSAIGKGTTVTLHFPALPPSSQDAAIRAASLAPAVGRILLVEDQEVVRRVMARLLNRAGHEVVEAPSVSVANTLLRVERFDLLVTDGILLDGTAAEVIARFRETHPQVPVILSSGNLEEIDTPGIDEGVTVLPKPFAPEELPRLARSLLSR